MLKLPYVLNLLCATAAEFDHIQREGGRGGLGGSTERKATVAQHNTSRRRSLLPSIASDSTASRFLALSMSARNCSMVPSMVSAVQTRRLMCR